MINESDLIAELRGGGDTQVTAEEFAAQVKGMTEEQAMESSETQVLTVFSEIAMSHGFTPTLAVSLLAEAGRDFEIDAEWTPEDAIHISNWLKEAQARKRRAGSELPYEPDLKNALKLPVPVIPAASVAVQVTVVVPTGNNEPEVGEQDMWLLPWVSWYIGQLEIAVPFT